LPLASFVLSTELVNNLVNASFFMNSPDQAANSPDHPPQRLADIVGTVIALLTLTLPLCAIARYSSNKVQVLQQITYPLPTQRE